MHDPITLFQVICLVVFIEHFGNKGLTVALIIYCAYSLAMIYS